MPDACLGIKGASVRARDAAGEMEVGRERAPGTVPFCEI